METVWSIYNLESNKETGLVIRAVYAIISKEDDFLIRHVKHQELTGDPTDPDFIPYADLTEIEVINWIKANLGQEAVDEYESEVEAELTAKIAEEAAKTTQEGLPW